MARSRQVFVFCKECDKEHHFYTVSQFGNTISSIKMSRDARYSPPMSGYSKDTLDLRTCLDHTKGRTVIDHRDRKVILLRKVVN